MTILDKDYTTKYCRDQGIHHEDRIAEFFIPDGITMIGENAFSGCNALSSITLGSVTRIENSAFWGCTSLTSITIPDGVITIDEDSFYGCASLQSVSIDV